MLWRGVKEQGKTPLELGIQQYICLFRPDQAVGEHRTLCTGNRRIFYSYVGNTASLACIKATSSKNSSVKKFHYFAKKLFLLFVPASDQSKNVFLVILTFLTAISYCREQISFQSLGNISSNWTFWKPPKYAPFPDPCSLVCIENTTKRESFGKLTLLCVCFIE